MLDTIPKEIRDVYMKDWKCPRCKTWSKIVDYCDNCTKSQHKKDMYNIGISLSLAKVEREYKDKYGASFSINDFLVESDKERENKALIASYLDYLREDNIPSKGILMFGNQGTGKNMYSNLIQFEAEKQGKTTVRATHKTVYEEVLELGNKPALLKYIQPDFLFLDEIGRVNKTDNLGHTFFDLINKRYSSNKQTIFTTNLTEGIGDFIDLDRLKEFKVIKFDYNSRRGQWQI